MRGSHQIGLVGSVGSDFTLKGINVEGRSTYVKYYQDEIKAYMKGKKALPNWEVIVGQFNCESNGVFPEGVVLE